MIEEGNNEESKAVGFVGYGLFFGSLIVGE